MNVVDSSAWIEFFNGGPNARFFEPAILATEDLVVPTMVLLEVYKHIRRHQGRDPALSAIAGMRQGRVEDLDGRTALYAGELGVEMKLPLADSVILATARLNDAVLWTQDADFEGMDDVRFKPKKS
jgi:predicted nucleic acid-binding protein